MRDEDKGLEKDQYYSILHNMLQYYTILQKTHIEILHIEILRWNPAPFDFLPSADFSSSSGTFNRDKTVTFVNLIICEPPKKE